MTKELQLCISFLWVLASSHRDTVLVTSRTSLLALRAKADTFD